MYKCYRLPENLDNILNFIINDLSSKNYKSRIILLDYINNKLNKKQIFKENADQLITYYGDNIIDADETSKKNFPIKKVDIFISHAHKDEKLAYKLAYLLEAYGLNCFIDSTIWNNVNDLIKEMADKFTHNNYDFTTLNALSSNSYLMLSSALVEMINLCECFFFIDTENSIYNESPNDLKALTFSPWIKLEIDTARIIEKRVPKRILQENRQFSTKKIHAMDSAASPKFLHPLSMSHLTPILYGNFTYWLTLGSSSKDLNLLDALYDIINTYQ